MRATRLEISHSHTPYLVRIIHLAVSATLTKKYVVEILLSAYQGHLSGRGFESIRQQGQRRESTLRSRQRWLVLEQVF